jgi:hypothetical protein
MLKIKTIQVPIFPIEVNFVSGDHEEFIEYLKSKYRCEIINANGNAVTFLVNEDQYIWFDENDITIPIMYHELGHATFDAMKLIGLDIQDQEAFCYIQEYLFNEISKYVHNLHWWSI